MESETIQALYDKLRYIDEALQVEQQKKDEFDEQVVKLE